MENKTNTGVLFKNKKQTRERTIILTTKEKETQMVKRWTLLLWVKQGKNGSFMSLSFSEPYVAPTEERRPVGDSIDDDLPF
jgi:hypothetical protein